MLRSLSTNFLALFALTVGAAVHAEVTRSSDVGFTITHTVNVPMPPPAAWSALFEVGRWWDPEHTYSGDARNMSMEPFVGGCFCEKLGMYAGVAHMTVIFAQPPKTLRLSGALGPLQQFAINGSMTWTVEAAGGGSRITMSYTASGYADRPLSEWAPLVDSVMSIQVQRLGRFIATGNPADTKGDARSDKRE
ncbi:MAG TPA: SRPBCC family protein [Steroidobacteraceae bacterium]|nr:SRPBCC family protein [Steroidobacteraceae bacterium]